MKNGLSGISAFCCRTQPHGAVGEVLGEVVALLRGRRAARPGVVPSYSAGSHWLFSPPMKP